MRRFLLAGAFTALMVAAPATAQQPTTPRQPTPPAADTARRAPARDTTAAVAPDTMLVDTTPRHRVKPGVAFYRSLLIPGWGQISGGAYKRAAVFITLQGASDFMLIKTLKKVSDAEKRNDLLAGPLQDSILKKLNAPGRTAADSTLAAKYARSPALLRAAVDSLDGSGHALVVSRKKQREDWITLALFWTLVSGMDAFINAQLQDFPADIGVQPRQGGGMLIRATVPVRRFW